jgi:CheY-like chemotaxis protein
MEHFCGRGERILLVEDDPDVMTLTGRVLLENGYAVFMCRKAGEALDLFESNRGDFDLVISDLILPDKRGIELVQILQEKKPGLKALLISGYPETRTDLSKVLHPGPVNRGIEISPDVQDGPHAVINEQVANGVAVRMALLYLLMGRGEENEISA